MRKHIFYNTVNFQPVTFRILFFRGIQTLQMRLSRKACFWWTQLLRPFCRAADELCNRDIKVQFCFNQASTILNNIFNLLSQEVPLPWKPLKQEQLYDPSVLVHWANSSHSFPLEHSSISVWGDRIYVEKIHRKLSNMALLFSGKNKQTIFASLKFLALGNGHIKEISKLLLIKYL